MCFNSRPEAKPVVDETGTSAERTGFVHLHTHSAYSLLEGAMPLSRVIDLAVGDQQPALAITDP